MLICFVSFSLAFCHSLDLLHFSFDHFFLWELLSTHCVKPVFCLRCLFLLLTIILETVHLFTHSSILSVCVCVWNHNQGWKKWKYRKEERLNEVNFIVFFFLFFMRLINWREKDWKRLLWFSSIYLCQTQTWVSKAFRKDQLYHQCLMRPSYYSMYYKKSAVIKIVTNLGYPEIVCIGNVKLAGVHPICPTLTWKSSSDNLVITCANT